MSEKTDKKLLIRNASDIQIFIKVYTSAYLDQSNQAQGVFSFIFFEDDPNKDGHELHITCIDAKKMAIIPIKLMVIISSNPTGLKKTQVSHKRTPSGDVYMEITNKEESEQKTPIILN